MPKPLSLKKAGPAKNQKSITHFFKNPNVAATQQSQISPSKTKPSPEKLRNKRKVLSPEPIIEIKDEPCCKSNIHIYSESAPFHTSKKLKSNESKNVTVLSTENPKKSPQKENKGVLEQFSKNNSTYRDLGSCTLEIKQNKSLGNSEKEVLDNGFNRSPLTPIDVRNVSEEQDIASSIGFNHEIIKSSSKNDNDVIVEKKVHTPMKVVISDDSKKIKKSPSKSRTPKKTPTKENPMSPSKLNILDQYFQDEWSPSKSGSTVKSVQIDNNEDDAVDDMFGEEWDMGSMNLECKEDLDLSVMQRCEVTFVVKHPTQLELKLSSNGLGASCYVDGVWLDTPLSAGEIVSVVASKDSLGQYRVGNSSGLISLRPDHLISSTSVVAGVFCKRKAILQERWRGIDSANVAMTIGILIHELVQKALTQNIKNTAQLRTETDNLIKESVQMLYDAGISEEEARSNMQMYITPLADFMNIYMSGKQTNAKPQKEQWCGHIDKVLDIEENLCCPQLGLKGKIDATLQVTIHERNNRESSTMPLELKSGKASMSAEHRGQLVLYGMMLALQRGEHPATSMQRGLLLYLKERVDVREVRCGYPERRDLMLLRNQLVRHLAKEPADVDPEQITDIEDAACAMQQRLPEPVHHEAACGRCPYLTVCQLHLWHTDGPSVSQDHPLSKLREQALGHLSPAHIKYFLHWTALLRVEERCQMTSSPLHALWNDSVDKRVKRGTCAGNLKLKSVGPSGDRHLHVFERLCKPIDTLNTGSTTMKGPQEGEFSIVSLENRPWIAAGVITAANEKEISILLERDLSRRLNKDTKYSIDTYESYATTVQNLTNLGVLLENTDRAERLRNLIIDKHRPHFAPKLPREVGRLGAKLMRSLNIQQQRAVLRALAADDYALLQGLPGTGKTQTVSVLVAMLAALKRRVLVTAHTHNAVDNLLLRLDPSIRVLRLGGGSRVAPGLRARTDAALAATATTRDELENLYESMEVVGVTCLGANHPMLSRVTFDVCIVDEATQVLQSTVLRPLFAANKFILVGDPEQLPPVVRSRAARRLGMEDSLFHRLMSEDVTSTLQLQYRMNQPIADVANRVAYNGRLQCADQTIANATLKIDMQKLSHHAPWLVKAVSPSAEHAVVFLDVEPVTNEGDRKNCSNLDEACVVLALVDALIEGGVPPTDIGVISPFRDQVALLRRGLSRRGADASTVDQFQGRDKPVIVYSCAKRDGQDNGRVKEGEILNDQRRLAVSVTRAKHKLLVVGHQRALSRYEPLQALIAACEPEPLTNNVIASLVSKYRGDVS